MATIEKYAIGVRNDMELIHTSLKVFDKQMGFTLYLPGGDSVTIIDIMLYNEISQTLFMFDHFRKTTKSKLYKNNTDGGELEILLEYENLNKWYTRTMASKPEIFDSLKKYDNQFRESIQHKILHFKKPAEEATKPEEPAADQ